MKKHVVSALLLTLFLAACSNDNAEEVVESEEVTESVNETVESSEDLETSETEEVTEEEVTEEVIEESTPEVEEESEPESEIEEEKESSDNALTVQEKTALALSDDRSNDYTFSAEELINERYYQMIPGVQGTGESAIFDIVLQDSGMTESISGLPEGMEIYSIAPSYGNFSSFIGLNDDVAVVFGSQYPQQTYGEVLAGGIELDLTELQELHGDNEDASIVAEKIKIADASANYIPVTKEVAAKIWVSEKSENAEGIETLHFDIHSGLVNPYFPKATVAYPMQTYIISSSPAAAGGIVVFTMNNDGSFRVYDAPTRFSDERWVTDAEYSNAETANILNSSEVHHIDELEHLYTDDILNKIVE